MEILIPTHLLSNYKKYINMHSSISIVGLNKSGDLIGLKKNNGEFPIEIKLNPISDENCLLVSIIDLTDRVQLQTQLIEKNIKINLEIEKKLEETQLK